MVEERKVPESARHWKFWLDRAGGNRGDFRFFIGKERADADRSFLSLQWRSMKRSASLDEEPLALIAASRAFSALILQRSSLTVLSSNRARAVGLIGRARGRLVLVLITDQRANPLPLRLPRVYLNQSKALFS